ncbi:MAG TPA: hypothetical protein VHL58_05040 [Thermoanaerobaculia bacterium]|nr:hypothetical protein [Thermoanaerobaculia bacterium]
MKKLLLTLATALLLIPGAAFANHYADFYVIPVASHTQGLNGVWMSDVAIQNFQSTPINVELTFVQAGEGNPDNVTQLSFGDGGTVIVPAKGSVLLKDVVNNLPLTQNNMVSGAILIGADKPFAVTSRSYITSPGGGTVGQTVVPARDFLENAVGDTNNAMATAYIPGLISNARYRSNLGFVAATTNGAGGMRIDVTIRNAAGAPVGATRQFIVAPGSIEQIQFSVKSFSGDVFDVGSAEFNIAVGDGAVIPYGSVVDNATGDAVFVTGQFPANAAFPGGKQAPSVFRSFLNSATK